MPPTLETIGATGKENESKHRSGRCTELLRDTAQKANMPGPEFTLHACRVLNNYSTSVRWT